MADYWLVEKQLVHKLFKVLVPRYQNYNKSFSRLFNAPKIQPDGYRKAVLELRGNPYPPLIPETYSNRNLIHNLLLDEAKKAYRTQKYKEIANKISAAEAVESNKNDIKVEKVEIVTASETDGSTLENVIESTEVETSKTGQEAEDQKK